MKTPKDKQIDTEVICPVYGTLEECDKHEIMQGEEPHNHILGKKMKQIEKIERLKVFYPADKTISHSVYVLIDKINELVAGYNKLFTQLQEKE